MTAHCATHRFGPLRYGKQRCAVCGFVKETALVAKTERASRTRPGAEEFTVEGACDECHNLGWLPFNHDEEIQRCDACSVFESDDEAHAHAIDLAIAALKDPRPRSGERFECVLVALEILADEKRADNEEEYD